MPSIMVDRLDTLSLVKKLGLDENEARFYDLLLSRGVMSMMAISKSTGIPRSSVYRICEKLIAKKIAQFKSKTVADNF